jgi:hypothetical protein
MRELSNVRIAVRYLNLTSTISPLKILKKLPSLRSKKSSPQGCFLIYSPTVKTEKFPNKSCAVLSLCKRAASKTTKTSILILILILILAMAKSLFLQKSFREDLFAENKI